MGLELMTVRVEVARSMTTATGNFIQNSHQKGVYKLSKVTVARKREKVKSSKPF